MKTSPTCAPDFSIAGRMGLQFAKRPKLLNIDSNAKTVKGQTRGFMTAVLYLAPFTASGYNVCPMAELAGCIAECLNTAGRGGMSKGSATFAAPDGTLVPDNAIQHCRIKRTRYFMEDRAAFLAQLVKEVEAFTRRAAKLGLTPVLRLNGTSDIRWENIPVQRGGQEFAHMFAAFPSLTAYDYTKISNRRIAGIANYSLSYSFSGAPGYLPHVRKALAAGMNLVVVFRNANFPAEFMGRTVVNGDETDLRFLDPANVVVGLKAKGRARKSKSPFVVETNSAQRPAATIALAVAA